MKRLGLIFTFTILLSIAVVILFLFKSTATYQVIINCNIIDVDGEIIRNFPGYLCDFYSNGDYLSANSNKGLRYFDRRHQLIWKRSERVHHKLTISRDEKRIYYLSSQFTPYKNDSQLRWDRMIVLNRSGHVLAENSVLNLYPEIQKISPFGENDLDEVDWIKVDKKSYEYTHANTFFEIGPNELEGRYAWLASGNYLVNLHRLGEMVLFLDPSLKKILHAIKLRDLFGARVKTHDLQILNNGNLLIYVNRFPFPDSPKQFYSRLVEYSFTQGKIVWEYAANPKTDFYTPVRGGVRLLEDDLVVFSDETKGEGWVRWIRRNGQEVRQWPVPFRDPETGRPGVLQDARPKDLKLFLKNNLPL